MCKIKTPVALIIFKRSDKVKEIIKVMSKAKPPKVYILADGPRNISEKKDTDACRKSVEESINWDCVVEKYYHEENVGVYDNIAGGVKWVFEREEQCIFLEDDNLPDASFFRYCEELLDKYKNNDRVLWICGTNYLETYETKNDEDYMFTQNILPCGWASWSEKFLKSYDGDLTNLNNVDMMKNLKNRYLNKKLYKQQLELTMSEKRRIEEGKKPISWDYQMEFTLRSQNLLGISPKYNLIKNIGVDEHSIHGGSTFDNVMTERFCGIETHSLTFPLKHPDKVLIDKTYEQEIENIILLPFEMRFKNRLGKLLRKVFKIKEGESIKKRLLPNFLNKDKK